MEVVCLGYIVGVYRQNYTDLTILSDDGEVYVVENNECYLVDDNIAEYFRFQELERREALRKHEEAKETKIQARLWAEEEEWEREEASGYANSSR